MEKGDKMKMAELLPMVVYPFISKEHEHKFRASDKRVYRG